jgi:hypothetical protein
MRDGLVTGSAAHPRLQLIRRISVDLDSRETTKRTAYSACG